MLSEKMCFRGMVPILMLASLISGIVAAVAHHLFYQSLNGEIVKSVSQQQWFLRIGTGLAFIAKMLLAAGAGIAYTQALWWSLQSRPVTLNGIDSFFGVVHDAWHFTSGELWYKGTLLLLLAIVIWALPIVAIVTPAALTVQAAPALSEQSLMVSASTINYDISSIDKWATYGSGGGEGYIGPSYRISRLVTSVASQGSILQIQAPSPNCSYTSKFYGPSLSCASLSQSSNATLWNVTNSVLLPPQHENKYDYIAWAPLTDLFGDLSWEATVWYGLEVIIGYNDSSSDYRPYLDEMSPDYARLYIYTSDSLGENSNSQILECGLFNTSFTVNFTYNDGQQNLQVTDSTRLNGVTGVAYNTTTGNATTWVPYVALMHAFGNLIGGYVEYSHYGYIDGTGTQVTYTVLMDTVEMQSIFNHPSTIAADSLTIANMTMMEAVEKMFMNTTLSLFSDSYYLQKSGDVHPILVRSPQNMYSYDSAHLLTAYGVGIFVTMVVIAIGFFILWTSQNSFGASFSAILRSTRNSELDVLITAEDTGDSATMSKRLGQTPLILQWELADGAKRFFFAIGGRKPVIHKDKQAHREADAVEAGELLEPSTNRLKNGLTTFITNQM